MKPIVAVVDTDSFSRAIDLIGGLGSMNEPGRTAVVMHMTCSMKLDKYMRCCSLFTMHILPFYYESS